MLDGAVAAGAFHKWGSIDIKSFSMAKYLLLFVLSMCVYAMLLLKVTIKKIFLIE